MDGLDAVVTAIQESVQPVEVLLSDRGYSSRQVCLPPKEPTIQPLAIHTLKGLVDYLEADKDGVRDRVSIHVVSPLRVELIGSPEGRWRIRQVYVVCDCSQIVGNGFGFGKWQPAEQFLIEMQSQFMPTEGRDAVLSVVGNIREENVRTTADDGVTQTVVAKAGIARVENVNVPNPVRLQPYRTFREVDQPVSSFVLRLQSGKNGDKPACALFESDGSLWALEAIEAIAKWLKEKLPDVSTIA